jgi:hypothetical protein
MSKTSYLGVTIPKNYHIKMIDKILDPIEIGEIKTETGTIKVQTWSIIPDNQIWFVRGKEIIGEIMNIGDFSEPR